MRDLIVAGAGTGGALAVVAWWMARQRDAQRRVPLTVPVPGRRRRPQR